MAITFQKLTEAEIKEEFKRAAASDENIANYIGVLKAEGITVGSGFKLKVGHGEEDDSVRATKRRFNAAAKTLGLNLKWKVQGHKATVEGKEVFVEDWLVVRANSSTVSEGDSETTTKKGRGRTPVKGANGADTANGTAQN